MPLTRILPGLLLWVSTGLLQATTYYVSPTGSDSNNGTSPSSPWRTIGRVNQLGGALGAGDVVLFQRNGVYRGKLSISSSGTTGSPIVVGAYGQGNDPVISGSDLVTGWTVYSGNIWRAPVGASVRHVYYNGERLQLARFPNSGWARTDHATSTTTTDATLNQSSGFWNGATLVIRTTNWSYDTARVTGFNGGVLTHTSTGNSMGNEEWGYFLRNKLALLDAPGEWYYDAGSGQLYVWCPGNANPNGQTIEAAVRDNGLYVAWQRHDLNVSYLSFRHTTDAALRLSGSYNTDFSHCTFTECQQAIRSTGNDQAFSYLDISGTYGTAVHLLDNNSTLTHSTFTDIALVPGLGESNWGYFGLRISGFGCEAADNFFDHIGYIGIVTEGDCAVRRNTLHDCLSILNDGGAIAFDNADGLVVEDNIVDDLICDLSSVAPTHTSFFRMGHGIYFGNTTIRNTIVRRNTVKNCVSSGIHVDHTMVASGNQVKDNVLFNNGVQLSISDFSNYNGPGAAPPYYVPSFNTVYSGNVFYCLTKEQLCMRQLHVNSPNWVDYGTFSNNRYFNPYNEVSIEQFNTDAGIRRYYTLEKWQDEMGQDAGSTRFPERRNAHATLSELTGNLVVNGTFDTNVDGWGGWPTNATATHNTNYLDNGCLRANLPNNSVYDTYSLRSPDDFPIQNGSWYRMRFSLHSNDHGFVLAGLKGLSQFMGPEEVYERMIPFSDERREIEFYFQSGLSDQAVVQFVNNWTEPLYYLDNVEVHRVTVEDLDPNEDHVLLYNEAETSQSFPVVGSWEDVNGNPVNGSVTLAPHASACIYRVASTGNPGGGGGVVGTASARVFLGGPMNWGTGQMRTDLRDSGVLPQSEPYTALGHDLFNAGIVASSAVWNATGPDRPVDWVVLELRNNDAGYSFSAACAAILKADGHAVDPVTGGTVGFPVTTVGKKLVVLHRNHLPAMVNNSVLVNGQVLDLALPSVGLFGGSSAAWVNGSLRALWPGDVGANGVVSYVGVQNDRDPLLVAIGGVVPTNTLQGYHPQDVNMDGVVKYSGQGNDRDVILSTIGGTVPTTTRVSYAP